MSSLRLFRGMVSSSTGLGWLGGIVILTGILTVLSGLLATCPILTIGTPEVVVKGLIGLVVQGWLIVVSLFGHLEMTSLVRYHTDW